MVIERDEVFEMNLLFTHQTLLMIALVDQTTRRLATDLEVPSYIPGQHHNIKVRVSALKSTLPVEISTWNNILVVIKGG